jgi:hypothetical protein
MLQLVGSWFVVTGARQAKAYRTLTLCYQRIEMKLVRITLPVNLTLMLVCVAALAQTGSPKQFSKDGLSFDYSGDWLIQDDSNKDGQSLTLARADLDVAINVFVHRGRITPDKLPDAKKAFIDPYVDARVKQFIQSGATPQQTPDTSEIAGQKADGVAITASLGGVPGSAKIYWTLVGERVVLLTYFGPDKQQKQFANVWDTIRNSIKIEDPKVKPKP